jgi:hypothetical protein
VNNAAKIADPELRIFAEDDEAPARSVIIEIKPVPLDLSFERKSSSPRGFRQPIANPNQVVSQGEKQAMDKLEGELTALGLGKDLVRLDTASAFVAKVSPEQLREISSLPLVGIIRPNRTHRTPPR